MRQASACIASVRQKDMFLVCRMNIISQYVLLLLVVLEVLPRPLRGGCVGGSNTRLMTCAPGEDRINVAVSGNCSWHSAVLDLNDVSFDRAGVRAAEFR
jgi:hypothetical protein